MTDGGEMAEGEHRHVGGRDARSRRDGNTPNGDWAAARMLPSPEGPRDDKARATEAEGPGNTGGAGGEAGGIWMSGHNGNSLHNAPNRF